YTQHQGDTSGSLDCFEYDPNLPDSNYSTTTFENRALEFLTDARDDDEPFFLYLSTNGPHDPYEPRPDHTEAVHPDWYNIKYSERYKEPNGAFNEQDISDKYKFMQQFPLLTQPAIDSLDHEYRQTLRTQLSIDEMVDDIAHYVEQNGLADNTYIF